MRQIHVLTPGDHFGPGTGSAIPTVVDGLCRHASTRAGVVVAEGTQPDRYTSADVLEYPMQVSMHSATRRARLTDAVIGRLVGRRPWARAVLGQTLVDQGTWEPAVVVAHNAPQLVPLVAARHTPVLHVHNTLFRSYSRSEIARVLDPVERIVCVSDWLAEQTEAGLPRRLRSRTRVVLNGVDRDFFADVPRRPRGDALRVAFLGRVLPWKGPDVLLRAVEKLQRTDIEVAIIGSSGFDANEPLTPFEVELRRVAEDVPGAVTFIPSSARSEVARLLASVDVCVVPSVDPEPFGLVALEAMAAGAAVVAARSGGLPEAVGDAGLLVDPGDVDQLAQALAWLGDDAGQVAQLAVRGAKRAGDMDWRQVAARYESALP